MSFSIGWRSGMQKPHSWRSGAHKHVSRVECQESHMRGLGPSLISPQSVFPEATQKGIPVKFNSQPNGRFVVVVCISSICQDHPRSAHTVSWATRNGSLQCLWESGPTAVLDIEPNGSLGKMGAATEGNNFICHRPPLNTHPLGAALRGDPTSDSELFKVIHQWFNPSIAKRPTPWKIRSFITMECNVLQCLFRSMLLPFALINHYHASPIKRLQAKVITQILHLRKILLVHRKDQPKSWLEIPRDIKNCLKICLDHMRVFFGGSRCVWIYIYIYAGELLVCPPFVLLRVISLATSEVISLSTLLAIFAL